MRFFAARRSTRIRAHCAAVPRPLSRPIPENLHTDHGSRSHTRSNRRHALLQLQRGRYFAFSLSPLFPLPAPARRRPLVSQCNCFPGSIQRARHCLTSVLRSFCCCCLPLVRTARAMATLIRTMPAFKDEWNKWKKLFT